ncbi:MAG: hypothetical protein RMK29_02825 [Myxococcales bacterium]|nr:hypothetical protein [Myxococcota bacterium]MDW8280616.1 hypothetical protein [Myxococcales bacterium]
MAEALGDQAAPAAQDPREEGAPIPPDAVDPELIRLPPPRRPRSPVLALAVVVLGSGVLYRLMPDLRYALQPLQPAELGEARLALSHPALLPGRYVALGGMPDLRNAIVLEPRGARTRSQLFRLLGTRSRILVLTQGPYERKEFLPRYVGRLRTLDELPYAAAVRTYYLREAKVLRALDLPSLRSMPAGALPVPLVHRDRAGEPITLYADAELLLRVRFPDDVRVLLLKSKFPSEPDASHELRRLGLPAGPAVETRDGYGYVLRLPPGAGRHEALARIEAGGMLFQQRIETFRVPLSSLHSAPEGLVIPGPERLGQPVRYQVAADMPGRLVPQPPSEHTRIPWEDLQAVEVAEALQLPANALILLDGESPDKLRWTLPVAALLLVFIGFNIWYLSRTLSSRWSLGEGGPSVHAAGAPGCKT